MFWSDIATIFSWNSWVLPESTSSHRNCAEKKVKNSLFSEGKKKKKRRMFYIFSVNSFLYYELSCVRILGKAKRDGAAHSPSTWGVAEVSVELALHLKEQRQWWQDQPKDTLKRKGLRCICSFFPENRFRCLWQCRRHYWISTPGLLSTLPSES